LSPAYDLNPDEQGLGLKLNISEDDNSLDFDLALSVAGYFSLNQKQAESILKEIKTSVSKWSKVATKWGISRSEQEIMMGAFADSGKKSLLNEKRGSSLSL
jgi:serine/threonine-protein kinase HipA